MPTYDYKCTKCKKSFEAFQSMKDDVFTVCPKELCCMKSWGKGAVKRQLGTGAGLIFKGSGFYITDYRSDGYKASARKDSNSAVSPSKTPESKPESKAQSKPESKPAAAPQTKPTKKD